MNLWEWAWQELPPYVAKRAIEEAIYEKPDEAYFYVVQGYVGLRVLADRAHALARARIVGLSAKVMLSLREEIHKAQQYVIGAIATASRLGSADTHLISHLRRICERLKHIYELSPLFRVALDNLGFLDY